MPAPSWSVPANHAEAAEIGPRLGTRETLLGIRGTRLHVRETGSGAPVLLLHGGGPGTSSEGWREVQALLGRNRRVIAPDFPGFGRSEAIADPEPAIFAEYVLALVEELRLDRPVVIGHSMGAQVATRAALAEPARIGRLVLVAPGGRFFGIAETPPGIAAIERFVDTPSEAGMREIVGLMNERQDDIAEEIRARMHLVQGDRLETQRAMVRKRTGPARPSGPSFAAARDLPMPVMLVWGAEERFAPREHGPQIHAKLPPSASYVVVEGAGHTIQHDQPEKLAHIVEDFLRA